jgi:biotin synthase-like enzyme
MCIELRENLENKKTVVEEGESAKRSIEAQKVCLVEAGGRSEDAMEAIKKWREKMKEAEEIMGGSGGKDGAV